ncbi:hypothetical protein TeGR_g706, partial [Tetraparma gracilis]
MAKSKGAKRKITGQGSKGSGWGAAEHAAAKHAKVEGLRKRALKKLRDKGEAGEAGEEGSGEEGSGGEGGGEDLSHRRDRFRHDTQTSLAGARERMGLKRTRADKDELQAKLGDFDRKVYERGLEEGERRRRETEAHNKLSQVERRIKARDLDPLTSTTGRWELKGAARPAQEVYDFDTRYVDKHAVALEESRESRARAVDLQEARKGLFSDADSPQPLCLDYLGALARHGSECVRAGKLKEARAVFKEGVTLDGEADVFGFRGLLVDMFLGANKPASVRRFCEAVREGGGTVSSGPAAYGMALVEYVAAYELKEEGSDAGTAREALRDALEANVYIGLYLAFHEVFADVVEHGEEVVVAAEGGVLEAVRFGAASEQFGAWLGTEGAVEWLRDGLVEIVGEAGKEEGGG